MKDVLKFTYTDSTKPTQKIKVVIKMDKKNIYELAKNLDKILKRLTDL